MRSQKRKIFGDRKLTFLKNVSAQIRKNNKVKNSAGEDILFKKNYFLFYYFLLLAFIFKKLNIKILKELIQLSI